MYKNQLKELCLEITNKCPLSCIHCSSKSSPNSNKELDFGLIKEIINNFKELGGEVLEISGGEPLIHKDIYRIIRYAKKKNLKVSLYTTGLKLNNKLLTPLNEEEIQKLINTKIDKFLFGLYSSNSIIHNKITKNDSFAKTIEVITKLKGNSSYVGIHFVPMKMNYQELENLCKKAASLGMDEFAILRFVPQGRGNKNRKLLELNKKEVKQLLTIAKKLDKKYSFIRLGCPVDFRFFKGNKNVSKCKIGKSSLTIRADGTVRLCAALKYKNVLGNIKNKSLKEIWKNSKVLNYVKQNHKKMEKCIRCEYFNLCKGKCLAQHLYNYGGIFKGKDPWCEIAKKVYQNGNRQN